MNINITTKFNIGDTVYVTELYEDYFPNQTPQTVKGVAIDIDDNNTMVRYYVGNGRRIDSMREDYIFNTYEECAAWCDAHN